MSENTHDSRGRVPERSERVPLPNPNTLFEYQLRLVDQSYLSFFQDRVRIEEEYIGSLIQLHQKSRGIDSQFDRDQQPTTVRQAWREMRDNLDREAETRTAFVSAIRQDIIAPLSYLKEEQDRTRKRIIEDLKTSAMTHQEYMELTLPRLKRNYLKKIQECDELRPSDRAGMLPQAQQQQQQQSYQRQQGPTSPVDSHNGGFDPRGSPPKHSANGPTPTYPLRHVTTGPTYRSSEQVPQPRSRSPGPSSLSDLAHQGKKALLGLLQENANRGGPVATMVTDRISDRAGAAAMKGVKAKRDAEEADKEYRKGVHWLETLRLQRLNVLRSGYTSANDFVWGVNKAIKAAMEKYVDCVLGTTSTTGQLASHLQRALDVIDPQRDVDMQSHSVVKLEAAAKRALPPVLYYNHTVGESKDLLFGTSLVDYVTARGLVLGPGVALGLAGADRGKEHGRPESIRMEAFKMDANWIDCIPRLVRLCIREIDQRGLRSEGIYRISGRQATVMELRHLVEKDEFAFAFNPQSDDVYCVSSLLKMYLRELPEPVFRFHINERIQHTLEREEQIANNFPVIRSKMRRLPLVHQATLRALIEHLGRVTANHQFNKMDPKNLSIVFGTPIFGEDEIPKGADVLSISTWKDTVLEDLIRFSPMLFDDVAPSSPPLPQIPVGEEPATPGYSSSNTKVFSPNPPPPAPLSAVSPKESDFSPLLPPRPDYSIHPGSRRPGHGSSESVSSTAQDQTAMLSPPVSERQLTPSPRLSPKSVPSALSSVQSSPHPNNAPTIASEAPNRVQPEEYQGESAPKTQGAAPAPAAERVEQLREAKKEQEVRQAEAPIDARGIGSPRASVS